MTPNDTTIQVVTLQDEFYLSEILSLHKSNKEFLGPLADQVFKDSMAKGELLAAFDGDSIVGYLCGSVAKSRLRIIHVAVKKDHRKRGIATMLISRAKEVFANTSGLQATCRRDYPAARKMWAEQGFFAFGEKPGRGTDRMPLTRWWLPLKGEPDLLSSALEDQDVLVAADTSVISALAREELDEGSSIFASHSTHDITLCLLPAVSRELDRTPDEGTRKAIQRWVQKMGFATPSKEAKELKKKLISMVDPIYKENDDSLGNDATIVAEAITCQCKLFLTLDNKLIDALGKPAKLFGLTIIAPNDLEGAYESLVNRLHFVPSRLAETELKVVEHSYTDWQRGTLAKFHNNGCKEKLSEFRRRVNKAKQEIADKQSKFYVLKDQSDFIMAAWNIRESNATDKREIDFFRAENGETEFTIARAVIWLIRNTAKDQSVSVVRFLDPFLSKATIEALQHQGAYINPTAASPYWELHVLNSTVHTDELKDLLPPGHALESEDPSTADTIFTAEHDFYPLKIRGGDIDSYFVPIRSAYATTLLAHRLTLFGRPNDLGLAPELVYFRSDYEQPPHSRILWYVSGDVQAIVASSQLVDVEVGPVDRIFSQYARFGVISKENAEDFGSNGKIAALRFRDTEIFNHPVPLRAFRKILDKENPRLQQATRISDEEFFRIYEYGRTGKLE